MKELFKDVLGWEGKYQASNTGKIKSLGNEKTRKEKILQPRKWKSYEKIYLGKDLVTRCIALYGKLSMDQSKKEWRLTT